MLSHLNLFARGERSVLSARLSYHRIRLEAPLQLYIGNIACFLPDATFSPVANFYYHFLDQNDNPLASFLIGRPTKPLPDDPRITSLGFISEGVKFDTLSTSLVVVIPSLWESLSTLALEACRMNVPVLVNGRCDVLKQQRCFSTGGLYYYNYLELAAELERLVDNPELGPILGRQGSSFVDKNYHSDIIRLSNNLSSDPFSNPPPLIDRDLYKPIYRDNQTLILELN